jgi:hypothetical protein
MGGARHIVANGYLVESRKNNGRLREQYIRYLIDELLGCSDVVDLGCGVGYPDTEKVPQT